MMNFKIKSAAIEDLRWNPDDLGQALEYTRKTWAMTWQRGQTATVRHGSEHMRTVRVIRNGRLGLAESRTDDWEDLLKNARSSSLDGMETTMDVADLPHNQTDLPQSQWDARMIPVMGQVVQEVYASLQELHPTFRPSVTVSYHELLTQSVTSLGGRVAWMRGYWEVSAGGRQVDGTDFHSISSVRIGAQNIPVIEDLLAELHERFQWGSKMRVIVSGRYPVLFLPPIVMGLLNPVIARLSGPALLAGTSPWDNQKGQQILSPLLSLVSDARIKDGPRTAPYDDEGTPSSRCPLVDKGVLQNFILDRDASSRLGHKPRGFGYRSTLQGPIQSLPSNVSIETGQATLEQLLRRHPTVLVLNGWIGGRPTNPMRGDIAGNASDLYCVENGEFTGRVKHAVVSVNAFDALGRQLQEVGADAQWVPQGMMQGAPGYLPPLLIEDVDVTLKH